MKKRTGKLWFVLLVCMLLAASLFAACANKKTTDPVDESGFGGSSNDYTDALETDRFIEIDGKLDEECWQGQKQFDFTFENVRVQVTTVFGDLGFYIGFTVKDGHVYACEGRDVWKGSSIEIYVDRADAGIKSTRTFQYRLSAIDRAETLYGYATAEDGWTMTYLPIYGRTQVQGVLNSGSTEGMTAEVFVRWDALGYDYTAENFVAPETVKFMPVYNQSSGAEIDSARDFWVGNGGDQANPLHYHIFDKDGFTDADADGAVIGDSAYGRAKSPGWDISDEADGAITSDIAGDQTIYFKNVYAENYAVTTLMTFNEALNFVQGMIWAPDPYPKAGLIAASEGTVHAYILDYDASHRSSGKAEGMFFQKGNPEPRADYWGMTGNADISQYCKSNEPVRMTAVKYGRYLLYYVGGKDTARYGGTFVGMREVAEVAGKASPGFYTLGCSVTFTDYAATEDEAMIAEKIDGILSIIKLEQTRGGALSVEKTGYKQGESATVTVETYAGYVLSSLQVGGVEKLGEVVNGQITVTMNAPIVTVTPTFTRTADEKTVRGKIELLGGNVTIDTLLLSVTGGGASGQINCVFDVEEDGSFAVALPKGDYKLVILTDGVKAYERQLSLAEDTDLGTIAVKSGWLFDGDVSTDAQGNTTVKGYNQFRAVRNLSATEFYVSTRLQRQDGNFDVRGTWETGGIGIEVDGVVYRIYVMSEGTAGNIVVYLGVDGGDAVEYRQGGTYRGTGAPIQIELVMIDGEIHLMLDGKTHYLLNAANTPSASLKRLFTSQSDRTFGFATVGKYMVFSDYDFGVGHDAAAARMDLKFRGNVTVGETDNVTVTASSNKPYFGETVTLDIALADSYFLDWIKLNGEDWTDRIENGKLTFVFTDDVTVTAQASYQATYAVTGSFAYASGLFTEGDVVTVAAGAAQGTVDAAAKTFTIHLPAGAHTVSLHSSRFVSQTFDVTLTDADYAVADTLTFARFKFEEATGNAYTGDAIDLTGNFTTAHFAGVEGKDGFTLKTTLQRTDNSFDVTGTWQSGGFVIRKNGGDYKFWLISGENTGKVMLYGYDPTNNYDNKIGLSLNYDYRGTGAPLTLRVVYTGSVIRLILDDVYVFTLDKAALYSAQIDLFGALFETNAGDTVSFGLLSAEPPQGCAIRFSDTSYRLGASALTATVSIPDTEGITASGNRTAGLGETATVTWTAQNDYAYIGVTVNGVDRSNAVKCENGTYSLTLLVTGDMTVRITAIPAAQLRTVSGAYTYAQGLYADGDVVTVTAGAVSGTVDKTNRTFSLRLPDGEYTLAFTSTRFGTIEKTVRVDGSDVTGLTVQFTTIRFNDNVVYTDSGVRIGGAPWTIAYFEGIDGGNAFAVSTVLQRDGADLTTNGTWYTGGLAIRKGNTQYMIYVMRLNDHAAVIFNIKDVWDPGVHLYDVAFPYSGTGAPIKLTLVYDDGDMYLMLENPNDATQKFALDISAGSDCQTVLRAKHELWGKLFDGGEARSFGILRGDPPQNEDIVFTEYGYTAGTENVNTVLASMKGTVSVGTTEHVTVTTTPATPTLFGSTVTVTAKPDDSYVLDWVKVDGVDVTDKLVDGVLTLTVAGDHVVTASAHYVERMYTVSGSFAYADGLYADGDTVTVASGGALVGTVDMTNKTFSIELPDGEYTLTFTSTRYTDVTHSVTVDGGNVTVIDTPTFRQIKFTADSAAYTRNGDGNDITINGPGAWQFAYFAGVNAKEGIRIDTHLASTGGNASRGGWWTGGFAFRAAGVEYMLHVKAQDGEAGAGETYVYISNKGNYNYYEISGIKFFYAGGTGASIRLSLCYLNNSIYLLLDGKAVLTVDTDGLLAKDALYGNLFDAQTIEVGLGMMDLTNRNYGIRFDEYSYSKISELPNDFVSIPTPVNNRFTDNTNVEVVQDGAYIMRRGENETSWVKWLNDGTGNAVTAAANGDFLVSYAMERADGNFTEDGGWRSGAFSIGVGEYNYRLLIMADNTYNHNTSIQLHKYQGTTLVDQCFQEYRVPQLLQGSGAPATISIAYTAADGKLHVRLNGVYHVFNTVVDWWQPAVDSMQEKTLGLSVIWNDTVFSDISYTLDATEVAGALTTWGDANAAS